MYATALMPFQTTRRSMLVRAVHFVMAGSRLWLSGLDRFRLAARAGLIDVVRASKQKVIPKMTEASIDVWRRACGAWVVSADGRGEATRIFRVPSHALAFGRALAFTTRSALFFCYADGPRIRQPAATPLLADEPNHEEHRL